MLTTSFRPVHTEVLLAGGRESSEVVVSASELGPGRTVFGVASMRVRRAMLELER